MLRFLANSERIVFYLKPFLAGGLFSFAFAPYEWRWAGLLSVALLLWLLRGQDPKTAAKRGFVFGLGFFGLGASWLYSSFGYAGVDWYLAIPLTGFFIAFLAAFIGLFGWVSQGVLTRAAHFYTPWLLAGLWVLFEFLRGWLFNGFPWLLLGYTVLDTPLAPWVPVLGVWSMGFMLALFAASAVHFLAHVNRVNGFHFMLVTALVFAPLFWLNDQRWTQTTGVVKEMAIVQLSIAQSEKWLPEQRLPTLKAYQEASLAHLDADLIIWPETAIPAFWHHVKDFYQPLIATAQAQGSQIISGVALRHFGADYNAVIELTDPSVFYAKTRLVPFAEYFPMHDLFAFLSGLFSIPFATFDKGADWQPPMRVDGEPMAVGICYEMAFASETFKQLTEAGVIVNLSNEAWFDGTAEPWQLREMARMRALESGRYVIRSNSTFSSVIDQRGHVRADMPEGKKGVLRFSVPLYQGETPYVRLVRWLATF
jgi:apolipoprotein N-acyltransferase